MFEIVDASGWETYIVNAPGRRPKNWLIEPETRRHALFKVHRYSPGEGAAEKASAEVGHILGFPVAETELARQGDTFGIISYRFSENDEELVDGGDLIVPIYPTYDRRRGRAHTFQLIEEVLPSFLMPSMIDLLVFDAVIGNSDRHQDNWSVILRKTGGQRLAPSYDHGAALGGHVREEDLPESFSPEGVEQYVRNGRSGVRWLEAGVARPLRHIELIKKIEGQYGTQVFESLTKVFAVPSQQVTATIDQLSNEYASPERKTLMTRLLERRIQLLRETFDQAS